MLAFSLVVSATASPLIKDCCTVMSAITDLLFHSIADAHTIRLGEIAHITNGAGDVQDANMQISLVL